MVSLRRPRGNIIVGASSETESFQPTKEQFCSPSFRKATIQLTSLELARTGRAGGGLTKLPLNRTDAYLRSIIIIILALSLFARNYLCVDANTDSSLTLASFSLLLPPISKFVATGVEGTGTQVWIVSQSSHAAHLCSSRAAHVILFFFFFMATVTREKFAPLFVSLGEQNDC